MPTFSIPLGAPTPILQNIVYALPARGCIVQSTAALDTALDIGGPFTAQPTSATTGLQTAATHIRCTTGGAIVSCKPIA